MQTSNEIVLRTAGLSKRFGTVTAVDNLDLELRAGEVLGFLGPNGSGKSTTIGMVLGLVRPSSGRIDRMGIPVARIGAVIDEPAFYPYLSGRDNLRAMALVSGGVPDGRIDALLARIGLDGQAARRPYKQYSTGMKQRLGIALTLLSDPKIVMLDEPTNGLDPAGQREVRALIPEMAREGRAVLLASHLLHEVQQVADRVAIIRKGRLIASGPVTTLLQRGGSIEIGVANPAKAAEILRALPFVSRVETDGNSISVFAPAERGAELNQALAEKQIYASSIEARDSSLEDVFIELTQDHAGNQGSTANAATPKK